MPLLNESQLDTLSYGSTTGQELILIFVISHKNSIQHINIMLSVVYFVVRVYPGLSTAD